MLLEEVPGYREEAHAVIELAHICLSSHSIFEECTEINPQLLTLSNKSISNPPIRVQRDAGTEYR